MDAFPTRFARLSTIDRKQCRSRSRRLAHLALYSLVALCALHAPALAVDDECGGLKVPGYTAKRIAGKLEMKVAVTPEKERSEQIGADAPIHIMDLATRTMSILNAKAKVVMAMPPPQRPGAAGKQKAPERITDREPEKDGIVKVTISMKTPKGKEWVVQTNCRVADGIWIERKVKTPQGVMESTQTDIKAAAIPASEFEIPSDYKVVKPPPAK